MKLQWVIFVFADNTKQFIHTGLYADFYKEYNKEYIPGYLYDVDKQMYVKLCESCQQVEVRDDLPELNLVDSFSLRFI